MSGIHSLLQRITASISARAGSSSGLYTPSGNQYTYAIGGVPLLSAATDGPGYGISSRPDIEQAIEQRKDQFDNYKDPGEYSLNQWWLRSQTSWIGGAGVVYQDPDTQGQALNVRYATSIGIDPFTDPDNIQLLRECNKTTYSPPIVPTGTPLYLAPAHHLSDNQVWTAASNVVTLANIGTSDISTQATATLSASKAASGCESFVDQAGNVFCVVNALDNTLGSTIYRFNSSFVTMTPIVMYNVGIVTARTFILGKARGLPWLGMGNKLYQLDPTVTAAALPAASASVPEDQDIVAICDGPDAIYVAANSDDAGYIYKTTFNASGVVNGLQQVAILPNGEQVNFMASYVATYLVISTVSSIRVAVFTGSGIQYGPPVITQPVRSFNSGYGDIAFFGTNAYVTVMGRSEHGGPFGVLCINLGSIVQDNNTGAQTNAYCTWVYDPLATTSAFSIITEKTGRILYSSGLDVNATIHLEHATNKIASGYLDTGRCRYNTVEPKLFKFMSIKTPVPLQGEVTVAILDEAGGVTNYSTYSPSLTPGVNDIATPIPAGPQNWLALRFTLRRNPSDLTVGGELDSWQFKALPGTIKQRSIVKNFLLFNTEKDQGGQIIINPALDRLQAIREMCQRGDTVAFQDLVNNISTQVVIDNYEFTMLAPPGPNAENYGGYLRLTMRTVADVVPALAPISGTSED